MLGSVGMPELIIILVIALMVFGPRRLPELGKAVGQTINEFKKGANGLRARLDAEIEQDQQQTNDVFSEKWKSYDQSPARKSAAADVHPSDFASRSITLALP